MNRRNFLKVLGYTALSASGAAAMLNDSLQKSFDSTTNSIIEKLKDMTPTESNIGGNWYKVSQVDVGLNPNMLNVQYAHPSDDENKFGYLSILSQSKGSKSYFISPDSTIVQVTNLADLNSQQKTDYADEIFQLINSGHFKSARFAIDSLDSAQKDRTFKQVNTALGGN